MVLNMSVVLTNLNILQISDTDTERRAENGWTMITLWTVETARDLVQGPSSSTQVHRKTSRECLLTLEKKSEKPPKSLHFIHDLNNRIAKLDEIKSKQMEHKKNKLAKIETFKKKLQSNKKKLRRRNP